MNKGGSSNPIVYNDYEGFIAKFRDYKEKTSDDCFTPQPIYEAVLKYVGTITDLSDKIILRPFFPGGDYEHAEYPANGVVVDNPPFSQFTKICRFYSERGIPFFLFGPGLTILSICDFCTAVIISPSLTFHNSAQIRINFATNLLGDEVVRTAPELDDLLRRAMRIVRPTKSLPKYRYPDEVVSVSKLEKYCSMRQHVVLKRGQCRKIRRLDNKHDRDLFGNHLLVPPEYMPTEAEMARAEAEMARNVRTIDLSAAERQVVESLRQNRRGDDKVNAAHSLDTLGGVSFSAKNSKPKT